MSDDSVKVLLLAQDRWGPEMAGPAIRQYEMAKELAHHYQVTVAHYAPVELSDSAFKSIPNARVRHLDSLIRAHDVVIGHSLTRAAVSVARHRRKAILDLYLPTFPEQMEHGAFRGRRVSSAYISRLLRLQLLSASTVLAASDQQRDMYVGMMAAAGRIDGDAYASDPGLQRLVPIVPFGLSTEPPVRTVPVIRGVIDGFGDDDLILIWAGGIWDWFDPFSLIQAVATLQRQRDDIKLLFLGTDHPDLGDLANQTASRARELSRSLGALDKTIFFNTGWVPYGQRSRYLLEADIGVVSARNNLENRYAFRTRLLDYLWAGLPVIMTGGDYFAREVVTHGFGEVVGFESPSDWLSAIVRLADDAPRRRVYGRRARELSTRYEWPTVLAPLVAACRDTTSTSPLRPVTAARLLLELMAARAHEQGSSVHRPATSR